MPTEPSDPAVVRSIAVTTGDVVAALELDRTSDDTATLRLTPPFSARMRARLHVDRTGQTDNGEVSDQPGTDTSNESTEHTDTDQRGRDSSAHAREPLYIEPEQLVSDPPEYPRPAETRAELLSDPETTYTVERHHERHADAVDRWRESVPGCIRDRMTLETPAGPTDVTVRTLESGLV